MAKSKTAYKTSATIGLYVTQEKADGYYHVRAYPVFIGLRPSEMASIDAGRTIDREINSDTIRNISGFYADETPNGLYLENLHVNSQGNNDADPRHLYGWDIDYRNVYSIDARKARLMAETLATIEKRMAKIEDKYGRPATFGAYLLRVADAIGATRFVVPVRNHGASSYRGREHTIRDLSTGGSIVDGMIRTWIDERIPGMMAVDC